MNTILRNLLIAASVVTLAFGTAACKKADNSSTDTSVAPAGAAPGASGAMSGNAVTNGPMGASGAAGADAASGASQ
ncbi:MAG TPA: hypothetical protein VNE00_12000 [Paraburkholderia sp.]|jgi:hypothetical protein|nr:hypothetical protein [Paraburkholderia sp.]